MISGRLNENERFHRALGKRDNIILTQLMAESEINDMNNECESERTAWFSVFFSFLIYMAWMIDAWEHENFVKLIRRACHLLEWMSGDDFDFSIHFA